MRQPTRFCMGPGPDLKKKKGVGCIISRLFLLLIFSVQDQGSSTQQINAFDQALQINSFAKQINGFAYEIKGFA